VADSYRWSHPEQGKNENQSDEIRDDDVELRKRLQLIKDELMTPTTDCTKDQSWVEISQE
jgi:hypothetical protein